MSFVNTLLRDLRYAARVLFKTPATTAIAVLALALGIGVNASSFISINSLVLHPLPYPRLGRIVGLWETLPELRTEPEPLAPANFFDLKQQSSSFEKIAAYRQWEVTLTGTNVPERVQAFTVAPDFFAILGMNASLGRTLSSNDDEPAGSSVVVVSQGFWKSHLAASPDVIGKPISLNGRRYTIAGVMPDDFDYPLGTQIWSPLSLEPNEQHRRANHNLMALGLLKPNVSAARASAEAATIASRLALQYPGTNAGRSIVALPFRIEREVMDRFVETVVGAAAFVLLLACANIGNLQLARAANRQKEIAVRAALGASRFAIARQLITESVLISCVAGFVGLLLASWNNAYVKSTFPAFALRVVPGLRTMRVDSMVVVLTFAVSILAGIVCSLPLLLNSCIGECARI
jgi:predicted permease